MELATCLAVMAALCLQGTYSGGHGGKHHHHLNIHVPEFKHHDFHTKVITIHHHHHKPKKEHHHHHHHHHKPHVPHHHKTSHKTHTTSHASKGHHHHHGHHHGHHGHHGHSGHHGHHGHHSHHGHHGHHHHDEPSYSPPTFEQEYVSPYTPSVSPFGGVPKVHGVQHTVKQVNVYDSLPGAVPRTPGGYEVTEPHEEEEDSFSGINTVQQSYPATFNFLRGAAQEPAPHDPFAPVPSSAQGNQDPFAAAPQSGFSSAESFVGTNGQQHNPFGSSAPSASADPTSHFPQSGGGQQMEEPPSSYLGGTASDGFLADDKAISDNNPVSFAREAGVQQVVQTGGHETVVY